MTQRLLCPIFILFILSTITMNCYSQANSQEIFKISRDTVHVNIEGRLSKGLLIRSKYYAIYEVRDPMSTQPIKKFYIINKNGKIETEIKLPEGILRDTYPKLYYWHDQILVNTESYKNTYYLDEEKGEFAKNQKIIEYPLFEDENYQLTSECHGEFGSKIYFKNKLTGSTHSINLGCPFLINKIGEKYFVNTSGMPYNDIVEIDDPTNSAAQTIFSNDFNSDFSIPTSFVSKGRLYHVYNSWDNYRFGLDEKKERVMVTKDSVKIGVINNGRFTPVYALKDLLDIELQQQLSPDYQICTFHTEYRLQIGFKKDIPPYMEAKYGFVEIKGNKIKIHYFISQKAE